MSMIFDDDLGSVSSCPGCHMVTSTSENERDTQVQWWCEWSTLYVILLTIVVPAARCGTSGSSRWIRRSLQARPCKIHNCQRQIRESDSGLTTRSLMIVRDNSGAYAWDVDASCPVSEVLASRLFELLPYHLQNTRKSADRGKMTGFCPYPKFLAKTCNPHIR